MLGNMTTIATYYCGHVHYGLAFIIFWNQGQLECVTTSLRQAIHASATYCVGLVVLVILCVSYSLLCHCLGI